MIRIFFVVSPWDAAENRIHFEQTKKENQPAANFRSRNIVEAMIAIAQVVGFLEAERLDQSRRVALIGKHRFPKSQVVRILLVVAGSDEVAGVALAQQFRHRSTDEDRPVIQMGRDEREHFPAMGLASL